MDGEQLQISLDKFEANEQCSASYALFRDDVSLALDRLEDRKFDLVVSSPPYNIRKPYERNLDLSFDEYLSWQRSIVTKLVGLLSETGSVCWQTGNFVHKGEIYPLDIHFYEIFKSLGLKLRNRIIWKFNFGLNSVSRLSGRYETVLWFTKSDQYKFNLDPVRIPQMYPGKRHSSRKVGKAGSPSGNPLGKNPSDFWEFSPDVDFLENITWDFPNVKANHPEKTSHPCQFPVELVERCVLAFTDKNDWILDPFIGTGSSAIAALKHDRNVIGIDKDRDYIELSQRRIDSLLRGELKTRCLCKPVMRPPVNQKVTSIPREWLQE